MQLSQRCFLAWLTVHAASVSVTTATAAFSNPFSPRRYLQGSSNIPDELWGFQSGSANGHTDAGGMIYDFARDQVILTGSTHDTQFFVADGAAGVDCFVASVPLPIDTNEISASEMEGTSQGVGTAAAGREQGLWKIGDKHRMDTTLTLDRCDLIAHVPLDASDPQSHEHFFLGGTIAVETNSNNQATSVEPLIYELMVKSNAPGTSPVLETSEPLKVPSTGRPETANGVIQNDLIIPSIMTAYNHILYVATVKRVLVVTENSSNAQAMRRIELGLTKFTASDDATEPLIEEWYHGYSTSIMEVKGNGAPSMTSGMFHGDPGLSQVEENQLSIEQEQIEYEIEQMESERDDMHFNFHRHEYKNDGVLISGLEVIDVEDGGEPYLIIAGSAPGTKEGQGVNQTMSRHPFMDTASTFVGDWDGYITKINAQTGNVMMPADAGTQNIVQNTWTYRVATQPKRDDFVQSICVPRFPHFAVTPKAYVPSVIYAIGTTQGIFEHDKNGGAFILQIDLDTMNILWKQQLSGMNVHGLACEVLVDIEAHGTTTRADSKDLVYIAGEVHGEMTAQVLTGEDETTTQPVTTKPFGETDVWVAQLRASDGKVKWIQQIGTDQQERLAKNSNNPSIADGEQDSNIGDTGSGKGALVIDRHGHALVYGTTNGSLMRKKIDGDRNRDIFVLRLHRDDGSYQSVIDLSTNAPSNTPVSTPTDLPIQDVDQPQITAQESRPTYVKTSDSGNNVNYTLVALGVVIPIVLGFIIIAFTSAQQKKAGTYTGASDQTEAALHVEFPSSKRRLTLEVEEI